MTERQKTDIITLFRRKRKRFCGILIGNNDRSSDGSYFRTSRGGSGALYSQSAIVRVMLAFDIGFDGLPFESGDEVRVLYNRSL